MKISGRMLSVIVWKEIVGFYRQAQFKLYLLVQLLFIVFLNLAMVYPLVKSARKAPGFDLEKMLPALFLGFIMFGVGQLLEAMVMREKIAKTLETLIATPATHYEIWLGKSLAMVLVGWLPVFAITSALIGISPLFTEKGVSLEIDTWLALAVGTPLVYLFFVLVINLLTLLLREPRYVGVLLIIVIVGGFQLVPALHKHAQILEHFHLVYYAGFVGCILTLAAGFLLLTRERVVRSC